MGLGTKMITPTTVFVSFKFTQYCTDPTLTTVEL